MFEDMEPFSIMLIGGAVLGLVFGLLGQSSRFCFRQAVGEIAEKKPGGQLRAWCIATLFAVAGTQAAVSYFDIEISASAYLMTSLPVMALVIGGVMFGIGMMLARGCAGRQVVLAATGNLRSVIVTMTIAFSGYVTMRGLLAPLRQSIENAAQVGVDSPGVVTSLSGLLSLEMQTVRLSIAAVALVLACGLIVRAVRQRQAVGLALSAAVIGLLIAAGWYVTGVAGYDEFEPQRLESLTFVAPGGNAMQFLMLYTGTSANFGIMLVGGVLLGSFISALIRRELKLQSFSEPREMLRYLLGATLMGVGAVMAVGCSIGQGLSGISTLAFASVISLSAITLGGFIGHALMKRSEKAPSAKLAPAE